jgi:DNA-binding MarR family transcriptional regulator
MTSERSSQAALTSDIQMLLRDLISKLRQVSDAVGARVDLKGGDLGILDLVARYGPMSPSQVTESTGIHPATLTGVVDRLEAGGWLARVPAPDDRRRIHLKALRDRGPELVRLYAPMNRSLSEICSALTPDQLVVVRDFLRDAAVAGTAAVRSLQGE